MANSTIWATAACVEADDTLDAAHEQSADGGARHAADAAEHDDDEDLEQEGVPTPGCT